MEILKELTSKWVAPMPNRWQLEPSPEGKNPMKNPPENLSRILSRKGKRGRKTLHPATTTHTHTHTHTRARAHEKKKISVGYFKYLQKI